MLHCCQFKSENIYYLKDTNLYTSRKLAIGFCPVCSKPVAELVQEYFNGEIVRQTASGIGADEMVRENKDDIIYSFCECNYSKFKRKPFGWKYGVNKCGKKNNKEVVKQYAYDFYGNKELIKTI